MSSSREEPPSVDPGSSRESDSAEPSKRRARLTRKNDGYGDPPQGRYSPVTLTVNVVRLLRGQGVPVSGALENLHQAIGASAELLRWLGVVPDTRQINRPREDTAELIAAATLMRGRDRAERDHRLAPAVSVTAPSMWNRLDMRTALARHDVGSVFRLMQRYGFSQRAIAALVGITQMEVSEIMSGRRRVLGYAV